MSSDSVLWGLLPLQDYELICKAKNSSRGPENGQLPKMLRAFAGLHHFYHL